MAVKCYLICPVRNATVEERAAMEDYVRRLEEDGEHEFHLPHRDVDQDDRTGGAVICDAHCRAMMDCDEVHVWLARDGKLSQGSVFDLGMAYMFARANRGHVNFRFVLANGPLLRSPYKCFENVLLELLREQA